jgi:hypothetical protein
MIAAILIVRTSNNASVEAYQNLEKLPRPPAQADDPVLAGEAGALASNTIFTTAAGCSGR